jgi:hypothetical protein
VGELLQRVGVGSACLLVLLLLVPWPSASASSSPADLVSVTLNGVVANDTPDFWGAFVDGTSVTADESAALNATPIHYLRFGANQIDEENWSTSCLYVPGPTGGVCDAEQENPLAFATLCKENLDDFCELGLPAEINSPSTDTFLMHWLAKHDGGWWPNCWSIGNEPQDWSDFNVPWSSWTTLTSSSATPQQFALDALNVTDAVRNADPGACIVGLESNGNPSMISTWLQPLLTTVHNLTQLAYHINPSDGHCDSQTLASWLSPSQLTQISTAYEDYALPFASGIPIGVHEFHQGCVGGTEADAVFVSAGIAQALVDGIPDVLYFRAECGGSTCLLNPSGNTSTVYDLYSELLEHVDVDHVRNVSLSGQDPETFAAYGFDNSTGGSLLVSNAAIGSWENVSLSGALKSSWSGSEYVQETNGTVRSSAYVANGTVELPPESTAVIQAWTDPSTTSSLDPANASVDPAFFSPTTCIGFCAPTWTLVVGGLVFLLLAAWIVTSSSSRRSDRAGPRPGKSRRPGSTRRE